MKKALSLFVVSLAIIVLVSSCMTVIPFDSSAERVIEFEGIDQDTMFTATGEFLASYIRDSREANEFLDKEKGKIIGDFYTTVFSDITMDSKVLINYNFTIRDGKVRVTLLPQQVRVGQKNGFGIVVTNETFSGFVGWTDGQVLLQQEALKRTYEEFFVDYEAAIRDLVSDDF